MFIQFQSQIINNRNITLISSKNIDIRTDRLIGRDFLEV